MLPQNLYGQYCGNVLWVLLMHLPSPMGRGLGRGVFDPLPFVPSLWEGKLRYENCQGLLYLIKDSILV